MMTLAELQDAQINPLVAREAYEQSARRLADALDTKTAFEQKAFTLFGGYLTITLALFGAGGAIHSMPNTQHLVIPLWLTGAVFAGGAVCFMLALIDKEYGAVASHPEMWLNPGTIDGPDAVVPTMLAYITFYHGARIDTSVAMNNHKAKLIKAGILAGIGGPIVFMLAVLCVGYA